MERMQAILSESTNHRGRSRHVDANNCDFSFGVIFDGMAIVVPLPLYS
jgi:hypothetical protein